jgi:hypothetical protein
MKKKMKKKKKKKKRPWSQKKKKKKKKKKKRERMGREKNVYRKEAGRVKKKVNIYHFWGLFLSRRP